MQCVNVRQMYSQFPTIFLKFLSLDQSWEHIFLKMSTFHQLTNLDMWSILASLLNCFSETTIWTPTFLFALSTSIPISPLSLNCSLIFVILSFPYLLV